MVRRGLNGPLRGVVIRLLAGAAVFVALSLVVQLDGGDAWTVRIAIFAAVLAALIDETRVLVLIAGIAVIGYLTRDSSVAFAVAGLVWALVFRAFEYVRPNASPPQTP